MLSRLSWACALASFLVVASQGVALAFDPNFTGTIKEVLVVPFDKYGGVTTSASYSGHVEVILAGFGDPVPGDGWAEDPFYAFRTSSPAVSAGPAYGLRLSTAGCSCWSECGAPGLPTLLEGQIPPYSVEHAYRVTIDVGSTPANLTFGNGDCGVSDNTGCYVVAILAH